MLQDMFFKIPDFDRQKYDSEEWSSQLIFQLKQLERRNLKN